MENEFWEHPLEMYYLGNLLLVMVRAGCKVEGLPLDIEDFPPAPTNGLTPGPGIHRVIWN